MPTRAAFYARFRSEEQLTSKSIELQSQSCLTTIQQHGWALVGWGDPGARDQASSQLYATDDGGKTWRHLTPGMP